MLNLVINTMNKTSIKAILAYTTIGILLTYHVIRLIRGDERLLHGLIVALLLIAAYSLFRDFLGRLG